MDRVNKRYLTFKVLFLGDDVINLGMITIRVWSTQKADTLLKLVTFRLEDLKLTWNDIVAITTDGAKVLCWGGY